MEWFRSGLAAGRDRARCVAMAPGRALHGHWQLGEAFTRRTQRVVRGDPGAAFVGTGDPCAGRGDLARRSGAGGGITCRAPGDAARLGPLCADRCGHCCGRWFGLAVGA